ncbi:LysR family transcriptional regulator [Clostridium scatologenes]|uniref:Transcriptional regulator, LysR family n=1 Tax=Clostridium scatologenes TaxID=1548 RepID=A0A0E3GSP6_CLOSL|nr:LysR family transcriptional regulator [Clostridium scatologenes]AKA72436.1 transcriptional regulator, LysR family [Clostridium scatologenes]
MDIRQLKYFIAIAEEGQITGAARKLNMAQPPLSYHLKLLEDELGVKLVERGSRKIKLTDAGKMLYAKASQILKLTETTVKQLKDFGQGIKGTLFIGTVSSCGATLLPDRIHNFNKKCPDISFEIYEGNTYKLLELLNNGLIEIGIVRTPFNAESFNLKYLSKETMIAVFNTNSNWYKDKKSICINDIMDKPLIIYRRFEKLISKCCQNSGFNPKIICKCDDARTALLWADSGIGLAIVPKSAIKLVNNSDLSYIEIDESELETRVAAIWLKNQSLSEAAKYFLNVI